MVGDDVDNNAPEVFEVIISNKYPKLQGFGLDISGGIDRPYRGNNGIFVSALKDQGLAEKSGCIEVGDKLLQVNDVNVEHVTHDKVVDLFLMNRKQVKLVIKKQTSCNNTQSSTRQNTNTIPIDNNLSLSQRTSSTSMSVSGFLLGIVIGCVGVVLFRRFAFASSKT